MLGYLVMDLDRWAGVIRFVRLFINTRVRDRILLLIKQKKQNIQLNTKHYDGLPGVGLGWIGQADQVSSTSLHQYQSQI